MLRFAAACQTRRTVSEDKRELDEVTADVSDDAHNLPVGAAKIHSLPHIAANQILLGERCVDDHHFLDLFGVGLREGMPAQHRRPQYLEEIRADGRELGGTLFLGGIRLVRQGEC